MDPELGGPCVDDTQCNDMIACTFDACDHSVGRCRFVPDDSLCQDDIYCNGTEKCDQKLGCVAGDPVDCSDDDSCTIDTCVEKTKTCTSVPRDADGDGDPDIHCGGGDCDDQNPSINSLTQEICGNGVDDNCNKLIDETPCVSPKNDTCLAPLEITASGLYSMNTLGAVGNYPTSCGPSGTTQDVVAAIELPPGPLVDVEVKAKNLYGVSIALAGQCGDVSSEIACCPTFSDALGGSVARIRARGLGSATQATAYPLYVTTTNGGPVTVDVSIESPEPAPTNETCGTALPLTEGMPEDVELVGATVDLESACGHPAGDLVYTFTLADSADVDIFATSMDGDGVPSISLRGSGCALATDEISCSLSTNVDLFRHSLAAGTYYVSVGASAPTEISLAFTTSPATAPPADEDCVGAPALTPNVTLDLPLDHHQDDLDLGCLSGAVDAAHSLTLSQASDILLVERLSQGDGGAVELARPACAAPTDLLSCISGGQSPILVGKRNVPAGDYRVISESELGSPEQVTAFVRPYAPATLEPFADGCADVGLIPPKGGFFQGNTANAKADFSAGCDNSGGPANGAPDQLLKLNLPERKRVIFDTSGSAYQTVVDVRLGPDCPGTEVPLGCSAAVVSQGNERSFLDLTLDPGTYYVQIDGLGGDSGAWFLSVFVVDPSN